MIAKTVSFTHITKTSDKNQWQIHLTMYLTMQNSPYVKNYADNNS